jgi:WD40 repeat protein
VCYSPDGTKIASASNDKTIRIWDINTYTQEYCLRGHTSEVRSVAFSPDGIKLVSGSKDTSVKLWDLSTY